MLSFTATPHASGGLSDRTNHVSNVCTYVLRAYWTPNPIPSPVPLRRRRRHRQGKARAARRRRLFSSNSRVVRGSGGSILDADGSEGGRTAVGSSPPGDGQLEAAVPILWGLAAVLSADGLCGGGPGSGSASRGRPRQQPWAWRLWSPYSPEVVGRSRPVGGSRSVIQSQLRVRET
jgi:hypothetical protein